MACSQDSTSTAVYGKCEVDINKETPPEGGEPKKVLIIRPPNTQLLSVNNRGPEYAIPSSPKESEYEVMDPEEDSLGGTNVEPQYSEISHSPPDAYQAILKNNRFTAHSPEQAGLEEEVNNSQVESEKTPLAANSGYNNIDHLPSLQNQAGPET